MSAAVRNQRGALTERSLMGMDPVARKEAIMFDRTIAALKERGKNEWEVAYALLAEVEPSGVGVKNGSAGDWDALQEALASEGIEYSTSTLRQYRDTAAKWHPSDRVDGVSFTAHRYALRHEAPRQLLTTLLSSKGRVTTEDVRAATKKSGAKQSAIDAKAQARKLSEALEGVSKSFARDLAASGPEGKAQLEALQKKLHAASDLLTQWLSSPTAQKIEARAQRASEAAQTAAAKPVPAAKPAPTKKKGRTRGSSS